MKISVNETRLILRLPEESDLDLLYEYKNDGDIKQMLGGSSFGYSRKMIRNWIEKDRSLGSDIVFVIALENNVCIGHVGLYKIDHINRCCEFGVLIGDKTFWGKGIGSAVTKRVVDFAFKSMGMNRIELSVVEDNVSAIALYESLHFKHEGTKTQAIFRDGIFKSLHLYSRLVGDYSGE